eukprot:scaffold529_cov308-Pinguiococcus_pyrenoidosus.AAC.14
MRTLALSRTRSRRVRVRVLGCGAKRVLRPGACGTSSAFSGLRSLGRAPSDREGGAPKVSGRPPKGCVAKAAERAKKPLRQGDSPRSNLQQRHARAWWART